MSRLVMPEGQIPSRVMLVGEAPGAEEERLQIPFQGSSGQELNRMLQDAGMTRQECFVTNVARIRPPGNDINAFIAKAKKDITSEHREYRGKFVLKPISDGIDLLRKEISMVKPNVIIALGNTPLWALTGLSGITKWRGSMLHYDNKITEPKLIPTYHPAAILRQWSWRVTAVADLRRAAAYRDGHPYPNPVNQFIIRPRGDQAAAVLAGLKGRLDAALQPLRISFDIETRNGHIACAGISWGDDRQGICIPFMESGNRDGYWGTAHEEALMVRGLAEVLTHPRAAVVGQNILYDSQYTYRHWGFVPRVAQDTMIAQHSVFSDQPKSLAHIASVYCSHYVYWKDEGKNWRDNMGEDQLWRYNLLDCVYTDEAGQVIQSMAKKFGLESVYSAQQKLFYPVLATMIRGVRVDAARRNILVEEILHEIHRRELFIQTLLGHSVNINSPKQMHALFYNDLAQTKIIDRQTGNPTLNDNALQTIAKREPLLKPLINAISDIRTLGIFMNFCTMPLDSDGRMRCAYNIGGSESGKSAPKTYRLSSSENAFGSGGNLQNIPSEKSKSIGKAAARGSTAGLGDPYEYPNLREMFIPDPGYLFWDGDLDRADLAVVVWEADDELLKQAMRKGVDLHLLNAISLEGKDPPPLDELIKGAPRYEFHYGPRKHAREFAKVFCHGTNYGGQPRTMAAHTGRTVHEVDRAQRLWFGAHPGIRKWHDRVIAQIKAKRYIENRFGYRWYIFDRLDSIVPEAIAWVPQSTVSNVINKIWQKIHDELPKVQVLLQVHDSLAGQFPAVDASAHVEAITKAARIEIPYEDTLVIPFSVKVGKNWGSCE